MREVYVDRGSHLDTGKSDSSRPPGGLQGSTLTTAPLSLHFILFAYSFVILICFSPAPVDCLVPRSVEQSEI